MSKIYLICPVRNCSDEVNKALADYVGELEAFGNKVHFPPRDVKQNQSGDGICEAHRKAMGDCDEIHFWWDPESKGSHFDFGMAYMLSFMTDIKFVIANKLEETPYKSYGNVIRKLSQ